MLVIFDLDGTLLDTLEDLYRCGNHILDLHGHPTHSKEAYRYFVGNGIRKLIERALPVKYRDPQYIERLFREFLDFYDIHKMDYTKPYSGIVELLEYLQNRGIQMAVASNKAHEAMDELMRHYFPFIQFVAVLGHRPGVPPKPSPEIIQDILKISGEKITETLYVGDSAVDMETARNAHLKKVGVLWGFRDKPELETSGADYFLESPDIQKFEEILHHFSQTEKG